MNDQIPVSDYPDWVAEPEYLSEPSEDDYYESKFGENYTGGYGHNDL